MSPSTSTKTTSSSKTRKKMSEKASIRPKETVKTLLANAKTILADVDKAEIMKSHERREYPVFTLEEVKVGQVLGVGGFGIVSEVVSLTVPQQHHEQQQQPEQARPEQDDNHQQTGETSASSTSSAQPQQQQQDHHDHNDHELDDHHYAVEGAQQKMASRCLRNGQARYAIKQLDPTLSEMDRTRGMIDMALEVKYLTVLWHPNIVKMRAISSGDRMIPTAFFIMDRLYETLDKRIETWKREKANTKGFFGFGKDKETRQHLIVERLIVAYDLAVAFAYIHANMLVYRDIKQENFGFDIRGDIKIFDFGLTKALLPSLKAKKSKGDLYRLTPITGSLPYMAPEVCSKENYGTSCDCFSFAFLFYELLALKNTPYHRYCPREYFERVVKGNERPTIHRTWPKLSIGVLKDGWNRDPARRPSMKNIAKMLRGDLIDMSKEETVVNRTRHMKDRSAHSAILENVTPPSNNNNEALEKVIPPPSNNNEANC